MRSIDPGSQASSQPTDEGVPYRVPIDVRSVRAGCGQFWLAQYVPEAGALPSAQYAPRVADVRQHREVRRVLPILMPRDCTDGLVGA